MKNRNSDETVANLDLMTKDKVTRNSFQEHIKCFAFIVKNEKFFFFLSLYALLTPHQ